MAQGKRSDRSILSTKVTPIVACELLNIGTDRIGDCVKNGFIHKDKDGLIALHGENGVIRGFFASLKRVTTERRGTEEKMRQLRMQEMELKIAERAGGLIDVETAETLLAERFGQFMSEIDGIAAAFTRDIHERRKLQGMINAVRNKFADECFKEAKVLEDNGDD